jgi:hypothetical protein
MKSKDIAKYKNIDEFLGITIYSSVMQFEVIERLLALTDLQSFHYCTHYSKI